MLTPEEGSRCALWVATSGEVETYGPSGKYFTDSRQVWAESTQGHDHALGKSLWELNEQLLVEQNLKKGKDTLLRWDAAARSS